MTTNHQILTLPFNMIQDYRSRLPRHDQKVWQRRDVTELQGLVYHQALGGGGVDDIARYHVGPNHISADGLPSLSYTFYVDRGGHVLLCNDIEDITYSQGDRTKPGDENRMYLSACFEGDFSAPGHPGKCPSTEQLLSAIHLWMWIRMLFGWDNHQLYGHYHFGKHACPGDALQQVVEYVRRDVRQDGFDLDTPFGRQRALQLLNFYSGALDGDWGPKSRAALFDFQRDAGITADGVWGPQTTVKVMERLLVLT